MGDRWVIRSKKMRVQGETKGNLWSAASLDYVSNTCFLSRLMNDDSEMRYVIR